MNLELMMYPMTVILFSLGLLLVLFGYKLIASLSYCNKSTCKNILMPEKKETGFTETCLSDKMYYDLLTQINGVRSGYSQDLNLLRTHEIAMIWEAIEGLKKKEND